VAAALVCSAAVLSGCGGKGATSAGTPFGKATASGKHAKAIADGRTDQFSKLAIRIAATPAQRASGSWSIACRIGDGEMASHDGDTFAGRTPLTVQMRPVQSPNGIPVQCSAVATATLAESGRITVQLLGA
jgi:hypothetical protein